MIGHIWHRLVLAGVAALLLAGCDMPVRVGIREARAAGVAVDAMPASHGFWPASAVRPQAGATAAVRPAAAPAMGDVLFLPKVPQPAGPDDVVGVKIEDTEDLRRRQITFGQVFEEGAVPSGRSVVARTGNGVALPTQLDVKTTNKDGSARMGIVTVAVEGPVDLMLVRAARDSAKPAVDLAGLRGRYDLTADLAIRNGDRVDRHHFDVVALLTQALQTGRVSYWLRGPLVTEGRVTVPVTGSLRLVADVRAYADGSVRSDLQFNNDIAMQPVGGALTYDVTIQSKGEVIFQRAGVRHFQYQTWHLEAWSNGPPPANVVHDIASMARAGATQNYDLTSGYAAGWLRQQLQSMTGPAFDILGNAGVTMNMGMTGGRPDIGPVTGANSVWLVTQKAEAARFALAQADAAGSIPWHFFDPEAGTYVTATKYPKLWSDGRGGKWDTKGLTQPVDGAGWSYDTAHQPELSYTAYILTGDRYRYDQLEAQAAACIIMVWPTSRQDSRGLVVSNMEQVRGRAWALREIDAVAFVAPDDAPMRPYFQQILRNNIDFMLSETRSRRKGEAFGWVFDPPGVASQEGGVTSPWMQDFLCSTLILSATRKVDGARDIVAWMSNYLVGRFLAADKGFRPNNATAYRMNMYEKTDAEPYLTWREVEAATIRHGFAKDSSAWANDDIAYVQAARGVLGGIVTVTGSADARRALDWLNANGIGVRPSDLRSFPTWNIVPMAAKPQ